MDQPSKASSFRASATLVFRIVVGSLVSAVVFVAWLGWHFGGWFWSVVASVGATVVAVVILYAATFLYAMSQDGG